MEQSRHVSMEVNGTRLVADHDARLQEGGSAVPCLSEIVAALIAEHGVEEIYPRRLDLERLGIAPACGEELQSGRGASLRYAVSNGRKAFRLVFAGVDGAIDRSSLDPEYPGAGPADTTTDDIIVTEKGFIQWPRTFLPQHPEKFRAAAVNGDMEAQFALGLAYEHGLGVPLDKSAALTWYDAAAERGHTEAEQRKRPLMR